MILVWRVDTRNEVWTNGELKNYLELCELGLKVDMCVPVPQPFPNSTLVVSTRREPADFFFAGLVTVASARLRAILEAFQVNAEFLALKTVWKGKPYTKQAFFLCNILDDVACFDYRKSRFKQTSSGRLAGVSEIEYLVLDNSKAKGKHLFMLGPIAWGDKPNPKAIADVIPCVSDKLAAAILQAKITGVVFSRPEHRLDYPSPQWSPD